MTNALTTSNQASTQLARAKRMAILMRIIEESAEPLTYDQMAQKMREHPWVSARWPTYSPGTATRDFQELLGLTRDDIQSLAMPYFERTIDEIDSVMSTLIGFVNDTQLNEDVRIRAANVLRQYADQRFKVFGLYAPTRMNLQKTNFEFTLDDFNKLRKDMQDQEEILEGEEYEVGDEYADGNYEDSA